MKEESRAEKVVGITVEQLLLAANVLSAQNPQGPDFDRKNLLAEASDLVIDAYALIGSQQVEIVIRKGAGPLRTLYEYIHKHASADFIPYDETVLTITGLKTKKHAINRFQKFVNHNPRLGLLNREFRRIGVAKDMIDELRREENAYYDLRRSRTNKDNAASRKKQHKSKKDS
jgi:hypothetical protein